jgi:hypothetical protein
MRVVGRDGEPVIDLGPKETTIAPGMVMSDCFAAHSGIGLRLG